MSAWYWKFRGSFSYFQYSADPEDISPRTTKPFSRLFSRPGQFTTRMNARWIFLHSRCMNMCSFNDVRSDDPRFQCTTCCCSWLQKLPSSSNRASTETWFILQFSDDLPARNRELRFTFDESEAEQFSVEHWSILFPATRQSLKLSSLCILGKEKERERVRDSSLGQTWILMYWILN